MESLSKAKLLLVFCALATIGVANAGPQVTVNFKNETNENATYVRGSSSNESTTYSNASPKPGAVAAGTSTSFNVRPSGASPISYATVRYQAGFKTCQFTTSYMMNSTPGGVRTPKWNRSAVSGGGARCDVTLTSVNYSNHNWVVSFVMR